MGTTSNHSFPYPEPTDRARNGSVAIRALAEAVDEALVEDTVVVIGRSDTDQAIGSAPVDVAFPGAVLRMDGFTFTGGTTLTYNDDPRSFLVVAEVTTTGEQAGSCGSSVTVLVNGAVVAGSNDTIQIAGAGNIRRDVTHRVSVPVRLAAGDTLVATAVTVPGGIVDSTGLRVFPIGGKA